MTGHDLPPLGPAWDGFRDQADAPVPPPGPASGRTVAPVAPSLPPTRLTRVVAGVSTRAGQGLSTFVLHAAWEMASTSSVILIDMDEAGGTIAESLGLARDVVERRSVESFYTGAPVTAERIRAAAVPVRARPGLQVVPGRSAGTYGPGLDSILPRMGAGLRALDVDYVFLDLGPCLAYPGLINPDALIQAIRGVTTRVVCVLSIDPLPFQHALQVMRRLGGRLLPDIVMWRWGKEWESELLATWSEEQRGLPVRSLMDWSDTGYARWLVSGRPALDVRHAVRDDLRL